jgi:tetratricopeptide (TPR) repeat protein
MIGVGRLLFQMAIAVIGFVQPGFESVARADFADFPSPGAKVTALRFYETPNVYPPREKRKYSARFGKGDARFVAWELHIEFPPPSRRVDLYIEQRLYRSDGSVFARQGRSFYAEAKTVGLWMSDAWGWSARGNWPAGSYRVDLHADGRLLASGTFRIDATPNDAIAASNKGRELFDAGRFDDAVRSFDRALRIAPGYPLAYNNRCAAYGALRKFEQALADCTTALRIEPTYADAYANRAKVYRLMRRLDEAIADYSRALAHNPNDGNAYHGRGLAYDQKGEGAKALIDLEKAQALGRQLGSATASRLEELRRGAKPDSRSRTQVVPEPADSRIEEHDVWSTETPVSPRKQRSAQ